MQMENKVLPIGSVLKSDTTTYTIVSVLGFGGFGITYKAKVPTKLGNLNVNAEVAIKEHFPEADCMRDEDTHSVSFSVGAKERVARSKREFIAEAKCLQSLAGKHGSIINVNEVFEFNNTAYYVMEYIDGMSLKQYVANNGPLSEIEMYQLMTPIVDAVALLHENRFTHLDIKPANIMLSVSNSGFMPVLIDFGLARHYNEDGSATSTVQSVAFSQGYAPVEQYSGITGFSPTVDVYSLGATMLYCLTGKAPRKSSEINIDLLKAMIPASVSAGTRRLILKAMSYQPFERQPSALTLMAEIERLKQQYPDADSDNTINMNDDKTVIADTIHNPEKDTPETNKNTNEDKTKRQEEVTPPQPPAPKPRTPGWVWIMVGMLIGAIAVGYILLNRDKSDIDVPRFPEKTATEKVATPKIKSDRQVERKEVSEEVVDSIVADTEEEVKPQLSAGDVTADLAFHFLSGPVKSCVNQWGMEVPFDRDGSWTGSWNDELGPRKFYRDNYGRIVGEEYNSSSKGHGEMIYEWSGYKVLSMKDENRGQYVEYGYDSDGTMTTQTNYLGNKTVKYYYYDISKDSYGNWVSRKFTTHTVKANGEESQSSGTHRRTISYY